jgi:hypothetical protein
MEIKNVPYVAKCATLLRLVAGMGEFTDLIKIRS